MATCIHTYISSRIYTHIHGYTRTYAFIHIDTHLLVHKCDIYIYRTMKIYICRMLIACTYEDRRKATAGRHAPPEISR